MVYRYDDAGRLTAVEYDNGTTIKYTYDKMGNKLTEQIKAPVASAAAAGPSGALEAADPEGVLNASSGRSTKK